MFLYIMFMTLRELTGFLRFLDRNGAWLFTFDQARSYFRDEPNNTLRHALGRHAKGGAILRLRRGLYANPDARSRPFYALEALALFLRPGQTNYLSLVSRLSELGIISQTPSLLTLATTGRAGLIHTPLGAIEFAHTPLAPLELAPSLAWDAQRGLWLASGRLAWEDLRRADRNLDLVDHEELERLESAVT